MRKRLLGSGDELTIDPQVDGELSRLLNQERRSRVPLRPRVAGRRVVTGGSSERGGYRQGL